MTIALEISYSSHKLTDQDFIRILHRQPDGSGAGFGQRDLVWYYKGWATAHNAKRRLQRKIRRKFHVNIYEEREE